MIFQADERRVIISFQKGEIKSNSITHRLEQLRAFRNFDKAIQETYLVKQIKKLLDNLNDWLISVKRSG
jgi:hypothetical protein